jgi:capsular polysaccharide biosynthesis protein
MEKNNTNVIEINVKELFLTLLRKSWIIILVTILCVVGAGFYTTNYVEPYYTSTAKLYILNKQGDQTTMSDLQMGSTLTQDYMILITSRPVMEKVINTLNLNMSYQGLASLVSVYTPQNTRVLELTVTYDDPDMAKLLVDTIAEVSTQSMVSIMGIDKVNVVEEGSYPYAPSGPNFNRNTRIAGMAGGLLTAFIIGLIFMLNDSIKSTEDIEKYLGLTTLGSIPTEERNKYKKDKPKNKQKNKQKSKPKQRGKTAA